ncbi:hypothetical protein GCM10010182_67160 [Actinomadura cremea]|nr:hypothetical protein GCM10010182_67160 [Actinomadura cremea]
MRTYESELDEIVAMVADVFEARFIDGTPAVTILREASGLCPTFCAGLLLREMHRRDLETRERDAAAEQTLREQGNDDGSWC